MKDMVSKACAKRANERPPWIEKTLWKEMCAYWDTKEAIAKSSTTSAAWMSDRNGLRPHKHVSGPKSFLQIEQEIVSYICLFIEWFLLRVWIVLWTTFQKIELGRPPTIGEIFVKTHTKKMGLLLIGRRMKFMRHIWGTRKLSWLPVRMMKGQMVLPVDQNYLKRRMMRSSFR